MNVIEVSLYGQSYRGPRPNSSKLFPYKITVYRESSKMSKSGYKRRVGFSWQTWKRFSSLREAEAAMEELIEQAEPHGPGSAHGRSER